MLSHWGQADSGKTKRAVRAGPGQLRATALHKAGIPPLSQADRWAFSNCHDPDLHAALWLFPGAAALGMAIIALTIVSAAAFPIATTFGPGRLRKVLRRGGDPDATRTTRPICSRDAHLYRKRNHPGRRFLPSCGRSRSSTPSTGAMVASKCGHIPSILVQGPFGARTLLPRHPFWLLDSHHRHSSQRVLPICSASPC